MLRRRLASWFRGDQSVPEEYRRAFFNLIADIGWFGVLNGSSLSFLAIYATRLGATAEQIGWINAAPAVMSLLFSLPLGVWIEHRPLHKTVVKTAIWHRFYYVALVLLPLLGVRQLQIWLLIGMTFLFYLPGTALSLSFNGMFAETVPLEWRGYVVGVRNAVYAVTTIVSSLLCGWILNTMSFPQGYQVVFAMGALGAAMSTLHLYRIRSDRPLLDSLKDTFSQPRSAGVVGVIAKPRMAFHFEVWRGPFGVVLLMMLGFHLAQYLPVPLFPIYTVNVLRVSDQIISLGNALFFLAVFLGSTQLMRITRRFGNRKTTGLGLMLLSAFPLLLSMAHGGGLYLLANFLGGAAWSMAGGALFNYLLERVPEETRAVSLAWFNLVANAGVLVGSLLGPLVGQVLGLSAALVFFACLRFLMGWVIIRWG